MLTVAIYGSRHQTDNVALIDTLLSSLSARGCRLIIHSKLYNHLIEELGNAGNWEIYSITDSANFKADLTISIGGDGTFLRTARWVGDKTIPIVGINTGHLGYLTAFDISEQEMLVDHLFKGEFRIENRSLLKVSAPSIPASMWPFALNEVAVMKNDTASMITVDAMLDDAPLASYLADGVIVATPTGSTGYNLSVGGPVMQPVSPVFTISPIAAHSLTMRPLVINDSSSLKLSATSRSASFRVSLDGRFFSLPCGTAVTVEKAGFCIRVIQKHNFNFADKLREKLLWGMRN